ncbi:MAG: ABC transporter substrate-binding protein [Rhodospirillaceae bacterium]
MSDRQHSKAGARGAVRAIGIGLALSAFAAAASATASAEELKVRLEWLPYGMHAPFHLATEKGWYKDAGLEVTIDDGNGSGPSVQLAAAGQYDIAHANLATMAMARGKGAPVVSIAGFVRKSDMGVLVSRDSDISTPKDLEGKTVYYSTVSFETPFIPAFFRNAGADEKKVDLVNLNPGAKIGTYLSGKGDAMISTIPVYTIDDFIPRKSKGILFADYGLPLPGFGLVASEAKLKEKPEAIGKFVAVVARALDATVKGGMLDEAAAAPLAPRPAAKLNPELLKLQVMALAEFFDTEATRGKPTGWQAESDWAETVKVMQAAGLLGADAKPGDFFTNQFIAEK